MTPVPIDLLSWSSFHSDGLCFSGESSRSVKGKTEKVVDDGKEAGKLNWDLANLVDL